MLGSISEERRVIEEKLTLTLCLSFVRAFLYIYEYNNKVLKDYFTYSEFIKFILFIIYQSIRSLLSFFFTSLTKGFIAVSKPRHRCCVELWGVFLCRLEATTSQDSYSEKLLQDLSDNKSTDFDSISS